MSMLMSSTELSEMICTRISHDLIGNIGAVANAVELMDDDPECLADVRPILDLSAHTLTARLKFFRLTFGLDNACPKTVAELEKYASDYVSTIGSRHTPINLSVKVSTPQLYKIILSGVMALSDVFIRGGVLAVEERQNGLFLTASSDSDLSVSKLESYQNVLKGVLPEENPSQASALFYLLSLLSDKNVTADLTFDSHRAELRLVA